MSTREQLVAISIFVALGGACQPGTVSGGADAGRTTGGESDSGQQTGGGGGAWRPFADSSPWNTRIPDDVAIRPDSDALMEHMRTSSEFPGLSVSIHPWSVPVYEVDASMPLVRVMTPLSNEGESRTFMWPVPSSAQPAPEGDGHLALIDRAAGRAYDFFQARPRGDGAWDCTLCSTIDLNGSGVRPPKGGPSPWYESHGSRACGFPLIAGLVRVEEIRAGRIDHALVIAYPGIRQRFFTSPASTGHPSNGIISPDRGVPCGGRVQLDPSIDVDALGLSPTGRIIARALQEYGAYVGDFSGSINLYADGSPEARAAWSDGMLGMSETSPIRFEDMRVIEWGELRSDG
ncbi:hypothetical protein [Sandaracinus amylolyticus]|uniref:hypothetical protein n=1 Tax=Sandaracinus amylolyticus TaxID=927083 RepID=UPI001F46B9A3|nr:hypothetical protein [Sandaracinus amylolyticus]UJR78326.1 Hypothetical protein I5071_3530 [Sandaracinus amylolyticus]